MGNPIKRTLILSETNRYLLNKHRLQPKYADYSDVFSEGAEQNALRCSQSYSCQIDYEACRCIERTHGVDGMGKGSESKNYQNRCDYCQELSKRK